ALCAVTGVAPGGDDDDAQAAQKAKAVPERRSRVPANAKERIAAAVQRISQATSPGGLGGYQDYEQVEGLFVREVREAVAAKRHELGESKRDAWAVAEVPE